MTIHEIRTALSPAEVIQQATSYFTLEGSLYAAFAAKTGAGSMKLHMEVGEIVIGTRREGDVTIVRGCASRGAHLLTRFLLTLGRPQDARQTTSRHGVRREISARVETFPGQQPAVGLAVAPHAA